MRKSFSNRNTRYGNDIETIVDVDYELDENGALDDGNYKLSTRVVRRDSKGRSRTIINDQQWTQISELVFDAKSQYMKWVIENRKNRKIETVRVKKTYWVDVPKEKGETK